MATKTFKLGEVCKGGGEITIEITKSIDSFDKHYDEVGFEENELSLPFQKGSSTYYVTTKEKSIAEQLESDGFGKIVSTYQGGGEIKYMVWVGDMPLDINGREELTLEEAELLKREWEEKGYDDVAIVTHL